jgi:hypothetical protein
MILIAENEELKVKPLPVTLYSKQILTGGYPDRTPSFRDVRPEINYWINDTALTKIQISKNKSDS